MSYPLSEFETDPVAVAFGLPDPSVARHPHCLFERSEEALKLILSAAGSTGGLWGREPIVDRNGKWYSSTGESENEAIDDFPLWGLPENQEYLLRDGPYVFLEVFTMVIDASTKREVLLRMRDVLKPLCSNAVGQFQGYDWYECVNAVPLFVDDLGWAYMPLGGVDETDYAIFVTSTKRGALLSNASLLLKEAGIVTGDIADFRRWRQAEWDRGDRDRTGT